MNREPIKKVGTDGRSLPRHVYLRRGKYFYVEIKGQKPIRIHADFGTPEFDTQYKAALDWRPVDELGDVIRRRMFEFHTTTGHCFFVGLETMARKRAVQMGREYALPPGWTKQKFDEQTGRCALTGVAFKKDRPRRAPLAPSIDRLDPKKGYTPDNCQLITYIANCAKNQFTVNEFLSMCRAVVRLHAKTRNAP